MRGRVRILFVLHYPGYLRYYDSVIEELAARGHAVRVSFTKEWKESEGAEALERVAGDVQRIAPAPVRRDLWQPGVFALRRAADYVRYLHPRYRTANHLRRRQDRTLRFPFRFVAHLPVLPRGLVSSLHRGLVALERSAPTHSDMDRFLRDTDPEVVLVSPLVHDFAFQIDVVKSARALRVPCVMGTASWDHLTSKGTVQERPDRVLVWNHAQREEAREFHGVPESEVVVTGAQPFDRWFGRRPTLDRRAFCARVGLPDARPYVLFLGSTPSISSADAEQDFVRRWAEALRMSRDPAVRELGVLVRPHPYNPGDWASLAEEIPVWPVHGSNPVNEDDRSDYFDSLYHSVATVGINTSAMIESAIVGRPVLTVRPPEFEATQGGTVHFHYMLVEHGGFLRQAATLEQHDRQLAAVLADPEGARGEQVRFVASFVRPRGADRPCTPLVADAIEDVAAMAPRPSSPAALLLRPLVWAFCVGVVAAGGRAEGADRARRKARIRALAGVRRARAYVRRSRPGRAARTTRRRARRLVRRARRRLVRRARHAVRRARAFGTLRQRS